MQIIKNFINDFFGSFRDINNYFVIISKIKEMKKTSKWKSFNLRSDWIGRMYTVVNLEPEALAAEKPLHRAWVLEKIIPLNRHLDELNFAEIIVPKVDEINGGDSYLVKYIPVFYHLTWGFILRLLFVIWVIYWILVKTPIIEIFKTYVIPFIL